MLLMQNKFQESEAVGKYIYIYIHHIYIYTHIFTQFLHWKEENIYAFTLLYLRAEAVNTKILLLYDLKVIPMNCLSKIAEIMG